MENLFNKVFVNYYTGFAFISKYDTGGDARGGGEENSRKAAGNSSSFINVISFPFSLF